MKLNKILVPVDFSESSQKAVEYAVELAGQCNNAQVDVLHVSPRPIDYLPLDRWIWGKDSPDHQIDKKMKEAGQEAMDAFIHQLDANIQKKITPRLEVGEKAGDTILQEAKSGGYDLIVMATRGQTGVHKLMMGSVAEKIVRRSECPVLTTR